MFTCLTYLILSNYYILSLLTERLQLHLRFITIKLFIINYRLLLPKTIFDYKIKLYLQHKISYLVLYNGLLWSVHLAIE